LNEHKKKTISVLGYFTQQTYHSKIEERIKIFQGKQKLKQYITTQLPLKKILKGILDREEENKHSHYKVGTIKPQGKSRQVITEKHRIKLQKPLSNKNN
jgi:hypothetical protein